MMDTPHTVWYRPLVVFLFTAVDSELFSPSVKDSSGIVFLVRNASICQK